MSEEQTTEHVDQMSAVDSYLSSYSLVEESDTDTTGDKIEGDEETNLEDKKIETPDGEKTEEEKVADAEAAKKAIELKDAPPATQTVKSLTEVPKGFHSSWFNKGEDGKVAFNRDDAMKFLLPDGGKSRFEYSADSRKVVEGDGKTEAPKDAYATFVEEEKKYRADVRGNMFRGLNSFKEAFESNGGDVHKAYAAALQGLNEVVATDFEERGFESQAKFQKRQEEIFGTDQNSKTIKTQARSNESLLMNEIAGKFALSPDEARGKYVELMKAGLPIINTLFDMANPEFMEGKTKAQLDTAFGKWWDKTASNQANLRFVYGLILNDVNIQLQPYMNEGHTARKKSLTAQNKRASANRPSNTNRQAQPTKRSVGVKETEDYFGARRADRV